MKRRRIDCLTQLAPPAATPKLKKKLLNNIGYLLFFTFCDRRNCIVFHGCRVRKLESRLTEGRILKYETDKCERDSRPNNP